MRTRASGWVVVAALALGACASDGGEREGGALPREFGTLDRLVAVIHPTQGHQARGTITFDRVAGGVRVSAELEGLKANSLHAFHIHEFGDCTAPDATSAGGHYNPMGYPHAGPDTEHRHAGDLGNLQADGAGRAKYEITVENLTLAGWHNPILGRGVIVHEGVDDFVSQPTGAAGGRIGCGVIGVAQPQQP